MHPTTAHVPRREATPNPEPGERPLAEIGGDIRDRLAVLLNATEVIRLGVLNQNPDLLLNLRLIEKQVHHLGHLADELDRIRYGCPAAGDGLDGSPPSDSRPVT